MDGWLLVIMCMEINECIYIYTCEMEGDTTKKGLRILIHNCVLYPNTPRIYEDGTHDLVIHKLVGLPREENFRTISSHRSLHK